MAFSCECDSFHYASINIVDIFQNQTMRMIHSLPQFLFI